MSIRRKPRKRRSRKKLAYAVIAVAFILAFFLAYSSLHSSPPKVAIVDHLSFFPEQSNPTFVEECINILKSGGLSWKYYKGEDVTVDFYRNLPSYGSSLIILRVHSAIMRVNDEIIPLLGLFTSELYSDAKARMYRSDIYFDGEYHNDSLFMAYFPGEDIYYFAIGPKFVEKRMNGEFKDTVIIMMGCEGLGYINPSTSARVAYTDMAEAFINKGAKVYIGWDGPVSVNHTDQATVCLLQHLISKKQNITKAVEETMVEVGPDLSFVPPSRLGYYPDKAGNYAVPNLRSSLTVNVAYTSPIPRAPRRSKYTTRG